MITRFIINKFMITGSGGTIELSADRIKSMEIRKRFLEDLHFRFLVTMKLLPSEVSILESGSSRATVTILEKGYTSETDIDTEIPKYTKPVMNQSFDILVTSDTKSMKLQSTNTASETDEFNIVGLDQDFIEVEIALVSLDIIDKMKSMFGGLFGGARSSTLLMDTLSSRGFGKMIVSPPSREISYKFAHIPNGSLTQNLDHINSVYGLYDSPYCLFFDIDTLLLLNFTNPNIILSSGKKLRDVILHSPAEDNTEKVQRGFYYDGDKDQDVVYVSKEANLYDEDVMTDHLRISSVMRANEGTSGVTQKFGNSSSAMTIYSDNPLEPLKIKNAIKINGSSLDINIPDCSYDIISPLKKYFLDINTEELRTKAGTSWGLKSVVHQFNVDKAGYMLHDVVARFFMK